MNDNEILVFFSTYAVALIALAVLEIVAMWRVFTKAGEKGWKCLIPIYDMHVFARICWKATYFWYSVLATGVIAGIGAAVGGTVGLILQVVGGMISLAYTILSMSHLSTRFGKSTGFTVLLILLNTIGMLILGFGSADYQLIRDPETRTL